MVSSQSVPEKSNEDSTPRLSGRRRPNHLPRIVNSDLMPAFPSLSFTDLLTCPYPVAPFIAVAGCYHSPFPPLKGLFVLLERVIRIEGIISPVVRLLLEECSGNLPILELDAADCRAAIRRSMSLAAQLQQFTGKVCRRI